MANMECLNNEDHLESVLSNEEQLNSEIDNVVEIVKKYIGSETDYIRVIVDNTTYTIRAELTEQAIENIGKFEVEIVSTLPTENISSTTIYLLPVQNGDSNNYYEEYLYTNEQWELIGTTRIDLSNYATLDTDQEFTGEKSFNKLNIVGENMVPVYEDILQTVTYTYNIENIPSQNPYGFALNEAGYYESTNKGVDKSYAMCKVSFTMYRQDDLIIELINYAESSYDFGVFSHLDKTLSESSNEDTDSSLVYKSYKSEHSGVPTTLTYSQVPAGEHFITIKFRKDSSTAVANDSLQFRIASPTGTADIYVPTIVDYVNYKALISLDEDNNLTINDDKVLTNSNIEKLVDFTNFATTNTDQEITGQKTFASPITNNNNNWGYGLSIATENTPSFAKCYVTTDEYGLSILLGRTNSNSSLPSEAVILGGGNGNKLGNCSVCAGLSSYAGTFSSAFGFGAVAQANYSIQLGQGSNNTANNFQVWDYPMLDKSTGKIPLDRMPTELADLSTQVGDISTLLDTINGESV